jgi:hypothetical protein
VCKKDLPELLHTSAEKATANGAALKYATCIRSHGVPDFPDPDGQGVIQVNSSTGIDESSPAVQKAEAACKTLDNGFGEESSVAAAAGSSASGGASGGS